MNPAARDSAPYGKACAGCSRAKCRCIPRGAGLPCERCERLQKVCQPSAVVRRRAARRPARAPSAAQLEEKLDGLAALLRAQVEGSGGTGSPGSAASGGMLIETGTSDEHQYRHSQGTETRESPESPSACYLTPQTAVSPLPQEPSPSQAEQYLRTFRENHLRMFPFVYIHPDTTASQLQRERPFLWLNIRASCSKSLQEQVALEKRIREVTAQKLLVDLEQNMDLLLGLIVFLSWAGEKFRGKPILGAFSSLTAALLSDLRLDWHVQGLSNREASVSREHGFPIKGPGPAVERTNEERRAALGCYVVTTSLACFLKIPSAVRWTAYMEDCVRHLSRHPETPGDEVLVATARTFRIIEDLAAALPSRVADSEARQLPVPPPMLLIKALRVDLEDVRKTTNQKTLENKVVVAHLLSTEAMINELPLHPAEPPTTTRHLDFGRTECFHACLTALTHFLTTWLSFTPAELPGLPMSLHMLANRCTQMLYRLALADDPAWDRAAVTGSVDVLATVERYADLYGAVPGTIGLETDGGDMYSRCAGVLRATVPIWRKALEEAGVGGGMGADEGLLDLPAMDMAFDGWFNDSFPPFNVL